MKFGEQFEQNLVPGPFLHTKRQVKHRTHLKPLNGMKEHIFFTCEHPDHDGPFLNLVQSLSVHAG
jgi:hypothetical protein